MNIKKIIRITTTYTKTGYLDEYGKFIYHSFDDEPAIIWKNGTKYWYKDNKIHRDNNLPAVIWSNGNYEYYKNGERYWFIDGEEEYYDINEVEEKFKNNIIKLYKVYTNILKDNGIESIYIYHWKYLIVDQSQYNLAVLKFI